MEGREPCGHRADDGDALLVETEERDCAGGEDQRDERRGNARQQPPRELQNDVDRERYLERPPVDERELRGELAQLGQNLARLERDAGHLAKLADDDRERDTSEEANQDRPGKEV